ncbi:MAG: heparinase II/III domain-containing protein [Betaproteobacteria bacterium]
MNPRRILRELVAIPPGELAAEAAWRLRRRRWQRTAPPSPADCSYGAGAAPRRVFTAAPPTPGAADRDALVAWTGHYLVHEFNLLGSGWVRVPPAPTLEVNPGNAGHAARLRSMISDTYVGMDWCLDFKSGFRWPATQWQGDVRFGDVSGVDIKVPWELARMQHLPQIALAALHGIVPAARAQRELRDEALDFMSANPPGWGPHWRNSMEVAIRIANWLLARDLLEAAGAPADEAFDRSLGDWTMDHGRHIAANLEWHPRYRGNHYLANLAGLVFCGAALEGDEADAWLAFGIRGIEEETARQFNGDGGGFEASTCYHRLSAEIVTYATAVAVALPRARIEKLRHLEEREVCAQHGLRAVPPAAAAPFPPAHFDRLRRAARFTLAVTKPSGRVVQVGDNDSGRFAKLAWGLRGGEEDALDHRDLPAVIGVLLGERIAIESVPVDMDWASALAQVGDSGASRRERTLARGPGLLDGLESLAFPDFGLYILRSRRLWLSLRCGESGMEPLGAHAHNDQLALELVVDGVELVRDPGSYLYTPDPAARDAYRSAAAHDVPRIAGREPASLADGMFQLRGRTGAHCLYFGRRGFIGTHGGYGEPVWRLVWLSDGELRVEDRSRAGPLDTQSAPPPFSPGYGLREG